VEVDGIIDAKPAWRGSADSITVVAGQTSDPVTIEMTYVGDDQTPPTALITPADSAVNVPTDTAVTVVFDEAVVEASLTSDAIVVSDASTIIPGTITYDSETRTATFRPLQELKVSTVYTVTVSTEVMNVAGLNMAQSAASSFRTTQVWYVDGEAANGSGQSWEDPLNTIAGAVAAAAGGEQIWVKSGTYLLTGQIVINKAIELMGGFAGTETQYHQRDWQTQLTTVEGGDSVRCFFVSADAIVDGFTITGGALVGPPPEGAGMYISSSAPVISNCLFTGNAAGPSDGYGGAIYIASGNPLISNCIFSENTAYSGTYGYGGAIYNDQGGPTITGCVFRQNRSSGGFDNYAGAIYNDAAQATTTIADCLFDSNSAFGERSSGGAVYNRNSHVTISGCRFRNNTCGGLSSYGAAIYNYSSDAIIQNCIFSDNAAGGRDRGRGGAIYNLSSNPAITNCTFVFNEALAYESTDVTGGGIANFNSNPVITNAILWDNRAQNGSQLYSDTVSSATVTYCNIDQSGFTTDGNLRQNPRFGEGYHLRADSPCIDQGDDASAPAIDIDGESRPQGSACDMGADEFLDSDGDQLPDYWEILNELDMAADDADSDTDSDLLPALAEYHLGTDPSLAETVLTATNRGAWSDEGNHTAADKSTPTGSSASRTYRSFFIFTIGDSSATVVSAAVRLELAGYTSIAAKETLQLYDVTTHTTTLAATGSGQTAIYDDLGSGVLLGEFDVTPSDQYSIMDIVLNEDLVAGINAAGAGEFAVGLRLETSGAGGLSFSAADEARVHQLVLKEE
jgi:hypothetical protein